MESLRGVPDARHKVHLSNGSIARKNGSLRQVHELHALLLERHCLNIVTLINSWPTCSLQRAA